MNILPRIKFCGVLTVLRSEIRHCAKRQNVSGYVGRQPRQTIFNDKKRTMKYKCSCCGQEHDEWPALTFYTPTPYNDLTEDEKKALGQIGNDFCVITNPDQTDRFIRCTLTQKVIDHCGNLEYGIWVSVSEKSYQDYYDNFESDNHVTQYFGWLCSRIPEYDDTLGVPTTVQTKAGNSRPEVFPHKDFDHPFVKDYYDGITKEEAERRIKSMLKNTGQLIDNEQ